MAYRNPQLKAADQARRNRKWQRAFWNSTAWRNVRELVLRRDNFTCAWCGRYDPTRRRNMQAHHVQGIAKAPQLALDPRNLITLCASCHGRGAPPPRRRQRFSRNAAIFSASADPER
jgi:5-methylcytosine-specific restriction enzyme A